MSVVFEWSVGFTDWLSELFFPLQSSLSEVDDGVWSFLNDDTGDRDRGEFIGDNCFRR